MVPETWIPAHRVQHHDGHPVPEEHGHIPGWVPVEKDNKQHCWHFSAVDYEVGAALVLRPDDEDLIEITAVPLADLMEQTGAHWNHCHGEPLWPQKHGQELAQCK